MAADRATPKPKPLDATDYLLLDICLRNPEASQQQVTDALATTGVKLTKRSVHSRLNKPHFREALNEKYEEAVRQTVMIAKANAPRAVRTHLKIMNSTTAEDRDKIAAAKEITRIGIETKVKIGFEKEGLTLKHQLDLSRLSEEQLATFEQLVAIAAIAVQETQ